MFAIMAIQSAVIWFVMKFSLTEYAIEYGYVRELEAFSFALIVVTGLWIVLAQAAYIGTLMYGGPEDG